MLAKHKDSFPMTLLILSLALGVLLSKVLPGKPTSGKFVPFSEEQFEVALVKRGLR